MVFAKTLSLMLLGCFFCLSCSIATEVVTSNELCQGTSFAHPKTGICTHPNALEAEGYTINENDEWVLGVE